jgi:hypothetical protein
MMKNVTLLCLLLILFTTLSSAQNVVTIDSLRYNDANGIPIGIGNTYTVSAIVTSSNQFGNSGPGSIRDFIAGVSVYGSTFANQVNLGDSVTVTGKLAQFGGLTEIDFTLGGASVVIHSSGHHFDTTVVTLNEIKNQQWNGYEEFEGMLVRINNVTIQGSGNFTGGTNYTISDPSDNLIDGLRIDDNVSSIIGTPIPSGSIDIIAVLGQYKFTAPYNTGYQILPRFIQDLVFDGSPQIINPVLASDITTSSFTVYYRTARNGNSKVKYGITPSLELDSVVIASDTTYHVVPVPGLDEETLYYYRAYSTNENGTSFSSLHSVTTSSSNPTSGRINVYFNFPVDTLVAIPGNSAKANVDFVQKLMQRINSANYSMDLALYSFFGMQDVAEAIILAKNRGVKVRVVYDNRTTQNSMQALINAGIPVLKRTSGLSGIMHNKFFIFDARDSIAANDWLWTGSFNVTSNEINWKNNVVELNDASLAQAYTIEFEEMWGGNEELPDPVNAKFGNQKSDNTPHFFSIGGRDVQVYFSPSDSTTQKIIDNVNNSDYSIYFAMFAFTRSDIRLAMFDRFNSGADDQRGLIDQINISGSQYQELQAFAEVYQSTSPTQHHKYAIFDASYSESDPVTLTGSHNWSSAAENNNDENTIIIKDVFIANQFMQEFKKRYNEAGGTGNFIIPVVNVVEPGMTEFSYSLYQNYPNPFNPVTTIRFEVPFSQHVELSVFDILGREVKVLYNDIAPAGIVVADFNADGLSSGVYFYRLKTQDFVVSKKLLLLK